MGVIRTSVRSLRASGGLSGRGHCCGTISGFWSDASMVEPFFLPEYAHLGTHTHLGMDSHLGMIAAPLNHTGSGCWGQESGVSVKGNCPFFLYVMKQKYGVGCPTWVFPVLLCSLLLEGGKCLEEFGQVNV